MKIGKAVFVLVIILLFVLAFIDLKSTDNEIVYNKPTENNNIEKEPGFEAVFTVIILLAVKYIITHYKEKY